MAAALESIYCNPLVNCAIKSNAWKIKIKKNPKYTRDLLEVEALSKKKRKEKEKEKILNSRVFVAA